MILHFLENEQDLKTTLNIINTFATFSGLNINKNKSEAMWLGTKREFNNYGFKGKTKLKILGIYFSNELSASNIKDNWEDKLNKCKQIITQWEKRNLSLIGKIHVVKTFLLS